MNLLASPPQKKNEHPTQYLSVYPTQIMCVCDSTVVVVVVFGILT